MAKRMILKTGIIAVSAAIASALWLNPAAAQPQPPAKTASATIEKPEVISVRQALTLPGQYKDKRTLLAGIFMGYNGSCSGKPPLSRNDVMVQDNTGLCIFVSGPLPDSFNADKRKGLGENIVLAGYVKKPQKGAPYFLVSASKNASAAAPPAPASFGPTATDKPDRTVDEILLLPDKFVDKILLVTGIANGDISGCANKTQPKIEGSSSLWLMASSVKDRCLWIAGPKPAASKTPSPVSIPGTLARVEGMLVLLAAKK